MALATIRSRGLLAMSAPEVLVEVHLANGLPAFHIVGLPQAEVRESRERVRAALQHLGFDFPNRRITVNLAPADLPKESGRFDLPIALGILQASGQLPADWSRALGVESPDQLEAVGELSLTGQLRPIRGAIAMALAMRRGGPLRTLVLPTDNAAEARLIDGVRVVGLRDLATLGEPKPARRGSSKARRESSAAPEPDDGASATAFAEAAPSSTFSALPDNGVDLSDIIGQPVARRMLEIAAAGEHSVLMIGPPGAGKSMLAQRLPTILPPLDDDDAAEVAALASLCGRFSAAAWGIRPFRAPHHTASAVALVGGGSPPRPGEISLAHLGVLFLDELPEFPRSVLETLREPLETGRVTLSRAMHQVDFPARFQFVAAMNPCPCGYLGAADGRCRCRPDQVLRYRSRVSGPLLDRIDLRLEVGAVPPAMLFEAAPGESSATVGARVGQARRRAIVRQGLPNARLDGTALQTVCQATEPARRVLHQAVTQWGLSARAVTRVQKVARTIADLADAARIDVAHMAEAVQFRRALSEL
ncbi:MAG: YifB family Mg chelatase-like AAA ATPase [Burkholderiaceae bacterium]